ncbi:MAG TPA: hypothetical protein VFR94_19935 [Nitrososphaeraceae archaeon]|nr:hypothetical protein [Nitrososphaeraceae archaeon]
MNSSSSSNTIYVVQEEGYGGSNLLGVFSTLQKAESFKKKFKEIYPNKYSSSSDFWDIRITEARVDSKEKYEEEAGWIWNEFNFQ